MSQLPIAAAFGILFCIVMARANATYWVGRGLRAGISRTPAVRAISPGKAARAARAADFVSRWGVLAVPLSFLTIGMQTAVNATAGAIRMPLRHYLPAVVAGSVIWATIYSALGTVLIAAVRQALAPGI